MDAGQSPINASEPVGLAVRCKEKVRNETGGELLLGTVGTAHGTVGDGMKWCGGAENAHGGCEESYFWFGWDLMLGAEHLESGSDYVTIVLHTHPPKRKIPHQEEISGWETPMC